MELYPFQEQAITNLKGNRHICRASVGAGKGSIALHWAKNTGKKHILIVSTASKRDVKDEEGRNDFEAEADAWFGKEWRTSLSSFSVISWQGLAKWWHQTVVAGVGFKKFEEDYCVVFDEVAMAKAGVSSIRGRAFLSITKKTDNWTGYTATPGDRWIDFYAYFTACGKVKNKTQFQRDFCNIQTFRGFPEIVGYHHEDTLKRWWSEISDTVDTTEMLRQLPRETHQVIRLKKPTGYDKFMKTRLDPDTGDFVDNCMGVCHTARQLCWSKGKEQWVRDFMESLDTRAMFLYNYINEGDKLEEIISKTIKKGGKIWRIDGKHHDVPTADSIGERDVVLVQWTSGSMGLNLQFINHWVSVSPNYSYSTSEQGRGRIKRIGQNRPMYFYYLQCMDTIETDIYKCLKNKSDFAEDIWGIEKGIKEGEK